MTSFPAVLPPLHPDAGSAQGGCDWMGAGRTSGRAYCGSQPLETGSDFQLALCDSTHSAD